MSGQRDPRSGGCFGLAVSIALLVAGVPTAIAAFTLALPLGGARVLSAAALAVYVPALLLTAWVVKGQGRWRAVATTAALGSGGAAALGAGGALLLNRYWDGPAFEQTTQVLGTSSSTLQGTHLYFLKLAPWPPLSEPYEVEVDAATHARFASGSHGQKVVVLVGRGALGMPYVVLQEGKPQVRVPGS